MYIVGAKLTVADIIDYMLGSEDERKMLALIQDDLKQDALNEIVAKIRDYDNWTFEQFDNFRYILSKDNVYEFDKNCVDIRSYLKFEASGGRYLYVSLLWSLSFRNDYDLRRVDIWISIKSGSDNVWNASNCKNWIKFRHTSPLYNFRTTNAWSLDVDSIQQCLNADDYATTPERLFNMRKCIENLSLYFIHTANGLLDD